MYDQEAVSFLDMIISTLCEHERALSEIVDRLEKVTRILESLPLSSQGKGSASERESRSRSRRA